MVRLFGAGEEDPRIAWRVSGSVSAVGRCFQVARDDRHAALLALSLGCATQQHEPVVERASGGEVAARSAAPTSSASQRNMSEPTRQANVRIVNLAVGRFLLEADARTDI